MEYFYIIGRKFDKTCPVLNPSRVEKNKKGEVLCFLYNVDKPFEDLHFSDFLSCPSGNLFRSKLLSIIQQFDIVGVKFTPVKIIDTKGNVIDDYTLMQTECVYNVLDKKLSEFEYADKYDENEENVIDPNKIWRFLIKKESLEGIPLNERMIFRISENWRIAYNKLIIDAIKKSYEKIDFSIFSVESPYNG